MDKHKDDFLQGKFKHFTGDIEMIDSDDDELKVETTKKLKMDIPESPFNVDDELVIYQDDSKEFDDPDEQLTDEEIEELINYQFDDLQWNKEKKFDKLMKEGHPHTQRGFYCYVISQMSDEQLQPHINNYVDWIERMNYKNELQKLPKEVIEDEYVIDLRKQQIKNDGEMLGNQIIDDLYSLLRNRGMLSQNGHEE